MKTKIIFLAIVFIFSLMLVNSLEMVNVREVQAQCIAVGGGQSSGLYAIESGCDSTITVSQSQGTCTRVFAEPHCGWPFANELAWCQANHGCKFGVSSVTGIDSMSGVCSYEQCSIVCNNKTIGEIVVK